MAQLLLCTFLSSSLLSNTALAQQESELGRLIFEAAPRPEGAIAGDVGAAGTGTGAPGPAASAPTAPSSSTPPEADTDFEADIRAYEARISETQAAENSYSNVLREQYDALGTLLQQSGAHTEAITAFESAMHIDRVNGGLYTLDQIPLVEKIIASHTALGNADEVNDFHEYLFYLQQKTFAPGDPRLLTAKEDWADWNVEAFMQNGIARRTSGGSFSNSVTASNRTDYVAIQNRDGTYNYVPRSQLPNVLNPNGAATNAAATDYMLRSSAYSVAPEMVIDERLRTARKLYEEIVEARVADATGAAQPDDFRIEHKLANVAYAVKNQLEAMDTVVEEGSLHYNRVLQPRTPPQIVTRGYSRNREALEAIAEKLASNPDASAIQQAQAYIHLGDWNVGFESPQRSQAAYRKAWEILTGAGMDEEAAAAVFMPRPLLPVPAFAIQDYSRELYGIGPDEALAYKGYIDITVNVNRYGDVRAVKVDETSPADASQSLRSILLDFVRGQKMRPAVVNGETVAREDLRVRYYFTY